MCPDWMSYDLGRTSGNIYKLAEHHCHYGLWKFNFTNRVISIWNGFSSPVVSAESINTFKN